MQGQARRAGQGPASVFSTAPASSKAWRGSSTTMTARRETGSWRHPASRCGPTRCAGAFRWTHPACAGSSAIALHGGTISRSGTHWGAVTVSPSAPTKEAMLRRGRVAIQKPPAIRPAGLRDWHAGGGNWRGPPPGPSVRQGCKRCDRYVFNSIPPLPDGRNSHFLLKMAAGGSKQVEGQWSSLCMAAILAPGARPQRQASGSSRCIPDSIGLRLPAAQGMAPSAARPSRRSAVSRPGPWARRRGGRSGRRRKPQGLHARGCPGERIPAAAGRGTPRPCR